MIANHCFVKSASEGAKGFRHQTPRFLARRALGMFLRGLSFEHVQNAAKNDLAVEYITNMFKVSWRTTSDRDADCSSRRSRFKWWMVAISNRWEPDGIADGFAVDRRPWGRL
jgi:hypothetical protein